MTFDLRPESRGPSLVQQLPDLGFDGAPAYQTDVLGERIDQRMERPPRGSRNTLAREVG